MYTCRVKTYCSGGEVRVMTVSSSPVCGSLLPQLSPVRKGPKEADMYLEKHHILAPHSPLYPSLCLFRLLRSISVSLPTWSWHPVLNVAVLKVFSCSGWVTEQQAPSRSPNEIFPGFWWSASGAAIALEACLHWALARDQGELSSTA